MTARIIYIYIYITCYDIIIRFDMKLTELCLNMFIINVIYATAGIIMIFSLRKRAHHQLQNVFSGIQQ